jgi:hypothetical protein
MSDIEPHLRRRFKAAVDAASLTARVTFSLGTIDGLSGQPQRAIYLIAVATIFDVFGVVSGKWADDPPREDYDSATRVARTMIREEGLEIVPAAPVAEAALQTGLSIDAASRYLGAGLRAFERMQGALARQSHLAPLRASEAYGYSHEAGYALISAGQRLEELTRVLTEDPARWFQDEDVEERNSSRPLRKAPRLLAPQRLPADVLAGLYTLGIPVADLERTSKRGGASSWRPERTREQAADLSALGDSLREWEPKPVG